MSRTSLVLCGACTVSLDLILQSTYLTLIHRYLLHDIATELLSQSFTPSATALVDLGDTTSPISSVIGRSISRSSKLFCASSPEHTRQPCDDNSDDVKWIAKLNDRRRRLGSCSFHVPNWDWSWAGGVWCGIHPSLL